MKQIFSDKDFTQELLPINRRKQFGFVYKNNWKRFLFLGFLLFIFALPLTISLLIRDFKAAQLVKSGQEDLLFTNELFFAIFIIPSFVILFIGLAGLFRILRNYVWADGILYKQDYLIGIKQNSLFFAIVGLIFITSYYASYILSVYININFVKYLPFAVFLLFIIPVSLIELSLISVYKNTFLRFTLNSIKIYFKKAPYILVSEIVILLIPVLLIILPLPLIIKYVLLFLFIFLLLPILCFSFQLLSFHIFDELINKENHKEIYRKGLFNQ